MMLLAAAATAFISCNKEVDTPSTRQGEKVSVKFYAQVNKVETKATLTPDESDKVFTAKWEVGDEMKIVAAGNDYLDEGVASWNGEFFDTDLTGDETRGTWEYLAYFPSDENIEFGANRVQSGDDYISKYDVMSGAATFENALLGKNEQDQPMVIEMDRLTSILYFHLKSDLDAAITSAKLTIEGGNIAAETVKIANGAVEAVTGGSNSITLTFAEGTAPNAKDFHLWFNILPVQATQLSLTVTTADKTMTLTNTTGKNYAAGKLNKVVKNSLTWNNKAFKYVRVNSSEDLSDGAYLIVYENADAPVAFNGGLTNLDVANNNIAVEINNEEILSTTTVDAARFGIQKSGDVFYIQSASGKYIGRATNSNGMDIESNGLANTITITSDEALIKGNGGAFLRYNKSSDQQRFRYYKNTDGVAGQQPIALYKYNGSFVIKQSADLSYSTTEFEITVGDAFTAPTLSNPHSLTVGYESDNLQVATVNATSGEVTLAGGTGTATITASFEGNENYNAGSASYSITVKPAPVVMQTLAALKEFSSTTEQETEINFNDVLVTWTNGTRAYIEDETAGMYVYGGVTSALNTGDVLNGLTKVKIKVYSGQNEITAVTGTALAELKTSTATVSATTLTVAEAISEQGLVDYENMRVEIKNTTVVVNDGRKYLSDGNGNQIQLFALSGTDASISDLDAGDRVSSAIGYPMNYNSKYPELVLVSKDDLNVTKAPVVSLTNIPTGSISAEGAEVTVGYSIANPVSGVAVEPSANVTWINSFEVGTNTIKFIVAANSGEESEERTGKVTVAYTGATSVTFDIIQNGNKQDTKQYFVKLTAAPEDWTTGSYLIVNEEASVAITGSGTTAAEVKAPTSVTITNGKIEATDDVKNLAIQIVACSETGAETEYLLQAGTQYFYNTSSTKNGFSLSTIGNAKKYEITLAIESDNSATITSAGSYLRYNPGNSDTAAMFNFYKATTYTGQKPIHLYKLDN